MHETSQDSFTLEEEAAIDAIARLWGIDRDRPEQWRLETFGPTVSAALENLAGAVFASTRGLVRGPDGEICVYGIDDPHGAPLMVCLAGENGPMLCTGIEDATDLLGPAPSPSPLLVLDVLQRLLDVATETWRDQTFQPARRRVPPRPLVDADPPAVAVAYGMAGSPAC